MIRFVPARAALILLALAPAGAVAADGRNPTVVELYQSQGCSSCPPALASVNALAARPDVLALTFAVTYWDDLGWKDTFASPAFTQRQWDYAHASQRPNVATPQTIINGRTAVNGGNKAELDRAIAQADRGSSGPRLAHIGDGVTIAAGHTAQPATVWLVRYDPRTIPVAIRAGENGGRTLPHRDIVRSLDAIGTWTGATAHFAVPAARDPAYRSAILLQAGKGGPIIAAGRL
ncbi:MAG: DUF1223 domain-containing protein [Pseudomonadota bacterium]|nr:DUF1223 domain-containing protein [Pseudomonadota bacterium]